MALANIEDTNQTNHEGTQHFTVDLMFEKT